jgi:hypothetical protein
LNYAPKNRQEWEDRGLEVVAAIGRYPGQATLEKKVVPVEAAYLSVEKP